jgi:chromosome segregation ATPase
LEAHLQAEQAQIEELSGLLQEREDRITELTEEVQYAKQNVSRLEENVRQRDAEASEYSSRLVNAESAAEELREELSALKREHARATEQKDRALADAQAEATRAKTEMESALQRQAHVDVNGQMLQERTGSLESELEKLRRQVHDLRQDSAAKDMKIVQFQQQIKRDREDMDGMNIAIDSKQQDLERVSHTISFVAFMVTNVGPFNSSSVRWPSVIALALPRLCVPPSPTAQARMLRAVATRTSQARHGPQVQCRTSALARRPLSRVRRPRR